MQNANPWICFLYERPVTALYFNYYINNFTFRFEDVSPTYVTVSPLTYFNNYVWKEEPVPTRFKINDISNYYFSFFNRVLNSNRININFIVMSKLTVNLIPWSLQKKHDQFNEKINYYFDWTRANLPPTQNDFILWYNKVLKNIKQTNNIEKNITKTLKLPLMNITNLINIKYNKYNINYMFAKTFLCVTSEAQQLKNNLTTQKQQDNSFINVLPDVQNVLKNCMNDIWVLEAFKYKFFSTFKSPQISTISNHTNNEFNVVGRPTNSVWKTPWRLNWKAHHANRLDAYFDSNRQEPRADSWVINTTNAIKYKHSFSETDVFNSFLDIALKKKKHAVYYSWKNEACQLNLYPNVVFEYWLTRNWSFWQRCHFLTRDWVVDPIDPSFLQFKYLNDPQLPLPYPLCWRARSYAVAYLLIPLLRLIFEY